MKIILKEDVERLGVMGDLVDVADGYARNYLLPKDLCAKATAKNVKTLEHEKMLIATRIKKQRSAAEETARKIGTLSVVIPVQVGAEGKLFGSVTATDVAEAIAAQGLDFDRKKILLQEPIKELGVFYVPIKVQHDVTAQVKVEIVQADAS